MERGKWRYKEERAFDGGDREREQRIGRIQHDGERVHFELGEKKRMEREMWKELKAQLSSSIARMYIAYEQFTASTSIIKTKSSLLGSEISRITESEGFSTSKLLTSLIDGRIICPMHVIPTTHHVPTPFALLLGLTGSRRSSA